MCFKDLHSLIIKEVDSAFSIILVEEYLVEGGYSKLVRSLAGLEEDIDSIGIITAENPMMQRVSDRENKERNKELAMELRETGYGFYQISGKYGNVEKPFVVPNITKDDIMRLGEKFEQESVIYVEKTPKGSIAEMIELHGEKYSVKSRVILPLATDPEDFYSLYKGRKFTIPFFDDVFQDKELSNGKIVNIS